MMSAFLAPDGPLRAHNQETSLGICIINLDPLEQWVLSIELV